MSQWKIHHLEEDNNSLIIKFKNFKNLEDHLDTNEHIKKMTITWNFVLEDDHF